MKKKKLWIHIYKICTFLWFNEELVNFLIGPEVLVIQLFCYTIYVEPDKNTLYIFARKYSYDYWSNRQIILQYMPL